MKNSQKGGGGFFKFILLSLVLGGAVFGWVCYSTHQPPEIVWQGVVEQVQKLMPRTSTPVTVTPPKPPPSPPPLPLTMAPLPKVAPVAAITNVVIPPPPPDPVAQLAEKAGKSRVDVMLLADTTFPIIYNGRTAGSGNIPANGIVQLVSIDLEKQTVTVACAAYGNSTVTLPIPSTDLVKRAPSELARIQAEEEATLKADEARKLAALTPPPVLKQPEAVASTQSGSAPSSDSTSSENPSSIEASSLSSASFVHPGLLHSQADFDRMKRKVEAHAEPWSQGWERLTNNRHSQLSWNARPNEIVYRGNDSVHGQNYALLFNDAAAAYALALRWKITGDSAYAKKGIEILNAWGGKLISVQGTSDKFLASGIYGYELANAAEILRKSPDWSPGDFEQFQKMMLNVFVPLNQSFLTNHNGTKLPHYWANWDLCNMASLLAIGVLTDRRDLYREAIDYFKHGGGNGSLKNAAPFLYPDQNLAQWQESGRDQGHTLMGIAVMGAFCQMAWNQGDDLFSYDDNRFLKAAEYVAKYNLGNEVPYTPYDNESVPHPYSLATISENGRGGTRPAWELVYNHYVIRKGLKAPYMEQYAARERPEGGGGDYGPNSGGFDQLGYGTLTFTLDAKGADKFSAR